MRVFENYGATALTTKITKDTKVSDDYFSELRDLRVLRGEKYL